MSRMTAVFTREIREKIPILPAALVVGLFPLVISRLQISHASWAETRDVSAAFLALLLGGSLAVTLGFGSTARDLSSRRQGFYLARPLSAFQLWGGKLAGSLFLVFSAVLLVWLPATVAGGGLRSWKPFPPPDFKWFLPFPEQIGISDGIVLAIFILCAIFFLSQAAGVAAQSRSAWLIADLALIGLSGVWYISCVRRLLLVANTAFIRMEAILAAVLLLALAAGCFQAVRVGRISLRRAHAAQSIAIWTITGAALLAFDLGSRWVVSAKPSDLANVDIVALSQSGDWIAVSGRARFRGGYEPMFLENVSTGKFLRTGSASIMASNYPVISRDGKSAAWTTQELSNDLVITPHTVRLDDSRLHPASWTMGLRNQAPVLVLSQEGSRLAILTRDQITVWDTIRASLIASAGPATPFGDEHRFLVRATFLTPNLLRIFVNRAAGVSPTTKRGMSRWEIFELDTTQKRLRLVGRTDAIEASFYLLLNARGDRLLVRGAGGRVLLLDGKTGIQLRTLCDGSVRGFANFLFDGRIALLESGGSMSLKVLSPEGDPEKEILLHERGRAYLAGELRPGEVAIAIHEQVTSPRSDARVISVDLASGKVESLAQKMFPVSAFSRLFSSDPAAAFAPGSAATRLFYGPRGSLVELDAQTHRPRTVLGSSPSR